MNAERVTLDPEQGLLEDTIKSIIIGLIVHKTRTEKKLTLQKLAKEAHVSKSFISDVERGGVVKPKSNKLALVADVLGLEIEAIRNLNLSEIQHMDDYRDILRTFNTLDFLFLSALKLNPQDVAGMIRASEDQGVTLAEAIQDLFTLGGITDRNIIEAIMRANREEMQRFNKAREQEADTFRKEIHFPGYMDSKGVSQGEYVREFQSEFLSRILEDEYDYVIDSTTLKELETTGKQLPDTSWVYIYRQDEHPPRLFIHPDFPASSKVFLLAREIFFARHNITKRPWYSRQVYTSSANQSNPEAYEQRWNFTQGSYFAGAVLLPRNKVKERLKRVFSNTTWDPDAFLSCAMTTTPSTFFIRLGGLMSDLFGIHEYSYMRFDRYINKGQRKYQITHTLNTLQGIDRDSYRDLEIAPNGRYLHHCRRWLAIDIAEKHEDLASLEAGKPVVRARRARYISGPQLKEPSIEDGDHIELFVFSILTPLPVANRYRTDSIAFKCDDAFKSQVAFWNDEACTYGYKLEGHACELCSIRSCSERVKIKANELKNHWLLEEWIERKDKKAKVEDFKNWMLTGTCEEAEAHKN